MTPRAIAAEIEELPPEDQVKVERYVRSLARRRVRRKQAEPGRKRDELAESILRLREQIRREHGTFDSVPIIRDLRENGPS